MKLGIKRGLLMALALLGMLSVEVVPAGANVPANAGVFVVTGTGNISPGLQLLPVGDQTFSFTAFQVTGVGTVHKTTALPVIDTSACGASGHDGVITPALGKPDPGTYPGDSYAFGTGLGFWGCGNGPLAGKGGLLYYTRVGPVVTVVLTKHSPIVPTVTVTKDTPMAVLVCVFVPVTPPPGTVTDFTLACAGAAADLLSLPV